MHRFIQEAKLNRAEIDPFFWLTNLTQTIDEQDNVNPYKPFPSLKYIEETIPVLIEEPIVFIPKSRSMMASWTVAGVAAWLCQTRPATTVIVQSRDEARSQKLVEYGRCLYSRSVAEWQRRHPLLKPLASQQNTQIEWLNDSWMKAITGSANKVRSEHPTIVIHDEAAFMDDFENCFNTARGAKPLHMWALSSAEKGPFFDLIENAVPCDWLEHPTPGKRGNLNEFLHARVKRPIQGLTFGRTENDWAVVHMHYSADPTRTSEWAKVEQKKYTSIGDWRKEQEIDPFAKDGTLVYPEFKQEVHVIEHAKIPKKLTRFSAIDPHPRTPHAFLWVGIDRWGDWYVYRELWPSKVCGQSKTLKDTDEENRFTIKEYCEVVAQLEGNKIEWMNPETDDEYGVYRELPGGEKIIYRYMDQAGKGFDAAGDAQKRESYWDRYQNFGLTCQSPKKQHQAGEDAIRELLKLRKHDLYGTWPRIHISDRCPELIYELLRHRYPTTLRFSPDKELPDKPVAVRTHLIDDLRYLATAPIGYIKNLES